MAASWEHTGCPEEEELAEVGKLVIKLDSSIGTADAARAPWAARIF